jgi:hypothetical protein
MKDCCDGNAGSAETYANQVCMPLNGRVRGIDKCIHQIVAALNAGGVATAACCCGHGKQDGSIVLEDGRELLVRKYMTDSEGNAVPNPVGSDNRAISTELDQVITRVLVMHESSAFEDNELSMAMTELREIQENCRTKQLMDT